MHHAGLHHGAGPDRLHRLGQALQSVTHQHQHVLDTAVAQFGQYLQPVLGAFSAVAGPQSEDVAVALGRDRQRHIDRPVGDLTITDLHVVRSGRSAVPVSRPVRFCGPPPEPDVRLSTHPALHESQRGWGVVILRVATERGSVRPGTGSGWYPRRWG